MSNPTYPPIGDWVLGWMVDDGSRTSAVWGYKPHWATKVPA
jgi:hypothetical protein